MNGKYITELQLVNTDGTVTTRNHISLFFEGDEVGRDLFLSTAAHIADEITHLACSLEV